MKNIKEQMTDLWNNHRTEVMIVGGLLGIMAASTFGYSKYVQGFKDGGIAAMKNTVTCIDGRRFRY